MYQWRTQLGPPGYVTLLPRKLKGKEGRGGIRAAEGEDGTGIEEEGKGELGVGGQERKREVDTSTFYLD